MLFPQKIKVVANARHINPHREVVVVQNDTAVEFLVAVIGDNGQTQLPSETSYVLTSLHVRKRPTQKLGVLQEDGNILFNLDQAELNKTGTVQAYIQAYHPEKGRITSHPFTYHVAPDPIYGAEIRPPDKSLIEQVIGEGPAIIAEAKAETELSITERTRLTGEVDGALLEMSQSKDAADQSAQVAQQAADNADDERERLTLDVSDKLNEVETARSATVEATGEATEAAGLARDEADAARLQKEEVEQILGAGPVASVNGETGVVTGLATQESMNQVTAQLADKVEKGQVAVSDIDKNKGKFDQTYMSDEFLQQMAGNTPINVTPADRSVTLEKTAFTKTQKNMFNKNSVAAGYLVNTSTGALSSNSNYSASDYIEVVAAVSYAFTNVNGLAWYDADKVFISANVSPSVVTAPVNAVFIRVSMTNDRVGTAQIEKGIARTDYEPYTLLIESKHIEKRDIDIEGVSFKTGGKNKFNKSEVVIGLLANADGTVVSNQTAFRTSDYLPIKANASYAFQKVYKVAWYDSSKNFISIYNYGSDTPGTLKSPSNAYYARCSVELVSIDIAQVEEGESPSTYESFRYVIDEKYLPTVKPSEPTNQIQSTGDDYEARRAIAERNAHDFIPNVQTPLNIPTYEGSGQTTHPSVLYFEDGWNGYKFWMAHTPYPNSDNFYENPSIVASNDNEVWDEPATNPIAPLPEGKGYQSDPTLFMRENTMVMWYRATTGSLTEIFEKTTTDGKSWTAPELLFDTNSFEMVRSQTVRIIEGKYCMWYTSGSKPNITLKYAESVDRKNWTDVRELDVELDSRFEWWHGDVIVDNGKIEMIIQCQSATENWSVFYTYSYDNVNWTPAMLLIKPTTNSLRFDNLNLYRPAFMMVDGEYYVYYSTPAKIALSKGKSIYSLGVEKDDSFPEGFPVNVVRTANNAYTADDTYDKYPPETITFTKIFGQVGFPTASGNLKTDSVWQEINGCRQYFYPNGSDDHYTRRAIADGWSSFKLVSATTV